MVCVSVRLVREPCENDLIDQDAVWGADSSGPKKPCITWVHIPKKIARACNKDSRMV